LDAASAPVASSCNLGIRLRPPRSRIRGATNMPSPVRLPICADSALGRPDAGGDFACDSLNLLSLISQWPEVDALAAGVRVPG